ncbi:peptide deformylase [Companilactobacillus ginsenosidimutans]|uniref:Peptide deformylase n=1 Tax=Companilactobacillus ginsenosidimutans TaxID=1007676 RepID=A0A0H4QJH2_9LACO|nr:peptide deformylase [Companilactobacillus ginsenosidimutans]AKP67186.1 peptide deformylase [Companilactobacillus ginsenosidimutans]
MIKPINTDRMSLSIPSDPATPADSQVVTDLLDTLASHKKDCVGMAANMIGVNKQIIAVNVGMVNVPMINPKILSKTEPFTVSEGCLSLQGERETTRYKNIKVSFQDQNFKPHTQEFNGFVAEIIQHEIDHFDGTLI